MAGRAGGKVQAGSGSGRIPARAGRVTKLRVGRKGDVSTDLLLLECKVTDKASISIKQAHLIKITREAKLVMKSPAMVISFPVMPDDTDSDWVLISMDVYKKLTEKQSLD